MAGAEAKRGWGLALVVAAGLLLNLAAFVGLRQAGTPVSQPLQLQATGNRDALAGGTAGVTVTVSDVATPGRPLADCAVEARIGGGEPVRVRTGPAGLASLMVPVPPLAGPAQLVVVAGQRELRTALRQPVEIVARHRLLLLVSQAEVTPGQRVYWLARVTDGGTGQPLADAPVAVRWRGYNPYAVAVPTPDIPTFAPFLDEQQGRTDAAGVVAGWLDLEAGAAPGTLHAEATSGDPVLGNASATVNVVASAPLTAEIATDRGWYRPAERVQAAVTVRDDEGWPVDDQLVMLIDEGQEPAQTARTQQGVARFVIEAQASRRPDKVAVRVASAGWDRTFYHHVATVPEGASPYRADLSTVDGPAEWGVATVNVLRLSTIDDQPASLPCHLTAGGRELWSGTTDAWGCASFSATWAEGDQPVLQVAGFPPQPVGFELQGPARSLRIRVDPVAFSEENLDIGLLGHGPGRVAVELYADGFLRSSAAVTLTGAEGAVTLPTPGGLAGDLILVARPLDARAGDATSKGLLLLPSLDAHTEPESGSRLLIAASPTPAAAQPAAWPLALSAAGIAVPPVAEVSDALRQIAVDGRIDQERLPVLQSWYGRRTAGGAPSGSFGADASGQARESAQRRVAEFQRWFRPALWTQVVVALAGLVMLLGSREARAARILAVLLPLLGAAALASVMTPVYWPAVAGLAGLALVGSSTRAWPGVVLIAFAVVLAAWGGTLADGAAWWLTAGAVALAGLLPVVRAAAARSMRRALALALLLALGCYGIAGLGQPSPPERPSAAAAEQAPGVMPNHSRFASGTAVIASGWRAPAVWDLAAAELDDAGLGAGRDRWRLFFDAAGQVAERFDPAPRALHGTTDWPAELVVGDELELSLRLRSADGRPHAAKVQVDLDSTRLDLVSAPSFPIQVEAAAVALHPLRLRAVRPGRARMTITVRVPGGAEPVVLSADIDVVGDGLPVEALKADRLLSEVRLPVDVPTLAVPGTPRLELALYGQSSSWCAAALERLAALPDDGPRPAAAELFARAVWLPPVTGNGITGPISAEQRATASLAFQRLLRYRSRDGGFAVGRERPEADLVETAWGLLAVGRYARSVAVDPDLMDGLRQRMLASQGADGAWPASSGVEPAMVTALATWALAGLDDPPAAALGRAADALTSLSDQAAIPHEMAWIAQALLSARAGSPGAREAVLRLAGAAASGTSPLWAAPATTPLGSTGGAAEAETCAAAVLALLQAGNQPEVAASGLATLVTMRRPDGGWGSPAATALAVAAEQQAAALGHDARYGTLRVAVNGADALLAEIAADAAEPTRLDLSDALQHGRNTVVLSPWDGSYPQYGLLLAYAIAWPGPDPAARLSVEGALDTTVAEPGAVMTANWSVRASGSTPRDGLTLSITPPAGWRLLPHDLLSLRKAGWLRGFTLRGHRATLYLAAKPAGPDATLWRLPTRFKTGRVFIGRGPRATVAAPGDSQLSASTATAPVRIAPPVAEAAPDASSATVLR